MKLDGVLPCFLREIPHRQILHPMPFCRIFGFSDFRKSGKSEHRKIRIFWFSGISEIRFPKIRISGNPKIRIFRFPDFRISENPDFRKSENPDFPISGASDVEFSEASDARHRRCPDPSKKHGDLQLSDYFRQLHSCFMTSVAATDVTIIRESFTTICEQYG